MFVLKVFYEEPAALGHAPASPAADAPGIPAALAALLAPPGGAHHRLYLAGTDLARPDAPRTGLTTLPFAAWRDPLAAVLDARPGAPHPLDWFAPDGARLPPLADTADWGAHVALVGFDGAPGDLGRLLEDAARPALADALAAVRALLVRGATVLRPEPAPDGHDLSVFSPVPLRDRLVDALRAAPAPGVRRFVAPYQKMRSEPRFYFERWGLDPLLPFVEEI